MALSIRFAICLNTCSGAAGKPCYSLPPAVSIELEEQGIRWVRMWSRGVDTQRFHPCYRDLQMRIRLSGGQPEKNLLLYAGRLAPEKQVETLLPVLQSRPDLCLALVGDGPAWDKSTGMSSLIKVVTICGHLVTPLEDRVTILLRNGGVTLPGIASVLWLDGPSNACRVANFPHGGIYAGRRGSWTTGLPFRSRYLGWVAGLRNGLGCPP